MTVEPADEWDNEDPVSCTTSSANVETETNSPNAVPAVERKSQVIGSSAKLRPSVMRRYLSRDRQLPDSLTLTPDFMCGGYLKKIELLLLFSITKSKSWLCHHTKGL